VNLRSYEEFEAEAKDMTADSTVAEIAASGGSALGIEVDVRDHEAVGAMVTRVVKEWGRVVGIAMTVEKPSPTSPRRSSGQRAAVVVPLSR
jgi:NAD(P)-dependent dehydrogenase (short-subunit alcohol dehydrogenase family)